MAAYRVPLVVVLGATGTGKSKLAIEIAKMFNGEIISADSMQIYKGLNIITNKVTEEEQRECPHHLLSYLEADHKHYNIVDFRDDALPIIDDLLKCKKLPIIVGGTNYYIESVLWNFLVNKKDSVLTALDKPVTCTHASSETVPQDLPGTSSNLSPHQASSDSVPVLSGKFPVHFNSEPRDALAGVCFKTSAAAAAAPLLTHFHLQPQFNVNSTDTDVSSNQRLLSRETVSPASGSDTTPANHCQSPAHPQTTATLRISGTSSQIMSSDICNRSNNSHGHRSVTCDVSVAEPPALDTRNSRVGAIQTADSRVHALSPDPEDFRDDPNGLIKCLHSMSNEVLYSRLQLVDPMMASRHHPNNRRKVVRALQVFYQTGRTISSVYQEQHEGRTDVKSGPLRYPHLCILWLKCQQKELDCRLDQRVDDMINRGLLEELETFHRQVQLNSHNSLEDTGHVFPYGILQMIGFKEFHDYLQLSQADRATETGHRLFTQGVSDLKLVTRRYAKQQIKWIVNRFCARPGPNVPPVYSLDSTDLSQWDKTVQEAISVVRSFTKGEQPQRSPELVLERVDSGIERKVCDMCGGRIFIHKHEWAGHLKSRKHKYNLKLAGERERLSSLLTARENQLLEEQSVAETDETSTAAAASLIVQPSSSLRKQHCESSHTQTPSLELVM